MRESALGYGDDRSLDIVRRVLALTVTAMLLSLAASGSLLAQGLGVGDAMPLADRSLVVVTDGSTTLSAEAGERGTVVVFWANTCPWTEKYESRLTELASAYLNRGIGFVGVNANDPVAFPEDAVDALEKQASQGNYPFAYVVDADAGLARAMGAERTPEAFLFDSGGRLVYRGAIDDSPAVATQVSVPYLRNAVEALLAGGEIAPAETNAIGCTIKFP